MALISNKWRKFPTKVKTILAGRKGSYASLKMTFKEMTMKNTFYLSGMFAGGFIWDRAQPLIEAENHKVLLPALCEISGKLDELMEEISAEIRAFNDPVTLISNSLGSYIALSMAKTLPEHVEKVIISGSAGFQDVKLPVAMNRRNPRPAAEALISLIFHDKARVEQRYIDMVIDCFEDNFMSILRLMNESNKSANAGEVMRDVRCPIQAIWGGQDVITPLSSALEAFTECEVQTSIVRQCGHSPMCELPEDFSSLVNGRLTRNVEELDLLSYGRVVNA